MDREDLMEGGVRKKERNGEKERPEIERNVREKI